MPIRHVVEAGDGISSIGAKYGFSPKTLWALPENESLRALRGDGDVLLAGDVVHVPDLRQREEPCTTDARHRFRRHGVPATLQLQLYREGHPRQDEPFELYVDGVLLARGRTDDRGIVRARVPPTGKRGKLVLGEDRGETVELALGHLDPVTELTGVQQRLRQLGFFRGRVDGASSAALTRAVRAFQRHAKLAITGKVDEATRGELARLHDKPSDLLEPRGGDAR